MTHLPASTMVEHVIRFTARDSHEAMEPYERPATQEDMDELSTRRFERLPHRPANHREVPAGAMEALAPVLGDLALDQLFVMPRMLRLAGEQAAHWAVTPTQVLAATPERLAVWQEGPGGGRVRESMAVSEVVALLDRTVLLHGRLEIVDRQGSLVVRYNTVGQSDLRALLRHVRHSAERLDAPLPQGAGAVVKSLPHKWMALVRSTDVQPGGRGPVVVAAGELAPPTPVLHAGIAALTPTELIVATDPTPDVRMAQYGFDLLVVPRTRVEGLEAIDGGLAVTADALPGRVRLEVAAHASLATEAVRVLGPLLKR